MARTDFVAQCIIKIDGQNVPTELQDSLFEVVVEQSLKLPGMFTIELHDASLEWVDSSLLDLGKSVEIKMSQSGEGGNVEGTLIKGEITSLEPNFSARGDTTVLVRGYDKSHRLHRGRKTRTFLRKTDSDVARTVASESGLSVEVDATNVRHEYLLQSNQTNMEFLQERAQRIGYQVFVADDKLYFKKGDADLGAGPELRRDQNLLSFRPVLRSSGQADKTKVRGWDPKQKTVILAEDSPNSRLNQGGMTQTGAAAAHSAFGAAEAVVVDLPVFSMDEAKAIATGLSYDVARHSVTAEGLALGDPRIKAGYTISLTGLGTRFNGSYYVTSATHIYGGDGYETHFSISGRQPQTLSYLLANNQSDDQSRGRIQGVVTGVVTNVNDPDNLGRVKVKYEWLGSNIESDWMRVAVPMAGPEMGFYYLPEVNDEVLVAFEHGDVHHPYIVGALWNNRDKPPKPTNQVVQGGKVVERIVKSRSGHLVILDDTDGKEQIIIRDKTGSNEIVIDSAKNSMTIKVDGDFTVDAKGKITLNSLADMTLESKANGKIKAGGNLNAEATVNGTFKGNAQLNLESTGMTTVKSSGQLSLQGGAIAELKAGIVKIN
jgi:phage protein D/phage baseplate assembly protein gpV